MPPRLKALFLLALALLRTLFRRAFLRRRDGLADFRANYAADGLAPVSADQRAKMAAFGRCTACGLCDRGERERIIESRGAYRGVMELVLAASRSMPDFAAAARGFSYVPLEVLVAKERVCPQNVPIRDIAAFVRDKAGQARVSLPVSREAARIAADS